MGLLQRHPFIVTHSKDKETVSICVHPRNSFTKHLLGQIQALNQKVLIEGPYGRAFDLHNFETVLMLASGVGIFAHIPYITDLLKRRDSFRTKTRDVLIWDAGVEKHCDPIKDAMDHLLRADVRMSDSLHHGAEHSSRVGKSAD